MAELGSVTAGRQVLESLANLDTPAKIATYLVSRKIKGKQDDPCACPIAEMLRQDTGYVWSVSATRVRPKLASMSPGNALVPSRAIAVFVKAFDAGRYPELIKK